MIEVSRRGVVGGLIFGVAAPAIVRVSSIMPVRVVDFGIERNRVFTFVQPATNSIFFLAGDKSFVWNKENGWQPLTSDLPFLSCGDQV